MANYSQLKQRLKKQRCQPVMLRFPIICSLPGRNSLLEAYFIKSFFENDSHLIRAYNV